MLISGVGGAWTKGRSNLKFPKKSFNEQWKEKHKGKT